ncbi:MAG: AAA domain-containing protein, partial [Candidatus Eisenbacteria bacterium]|nr:AAA domain-containing protein [Candidatus Latescibacterota bacterium]MBD3301077.1 AAA domain-containing protein [Candidatus Eisenbacteria bacterium]
LRCESRTGAAESACREAVQLALQVCPPIPPHRWFGPAAILRRWADLLFDQGLEAEAARHLRRAFDLIGDGDHEERGRLLLLDARVRLKQGDEEAGHRRIAEAERIFRRGNRIAALAEALLLRGEAVGLSSARIADRCAARDKVFEACALFRRLGRTRETASCERWLEALRPRAPEQELERIRGRKLPRVPRSRRLSRLGFVTADPRILQAIAPLESLARTRIPILVLGESGTGKEVLARALHRAAGGRGPFVAVNCGALPFELQESELFGHARGAFTGAIAEKMGLFEAADGGTLLLDEIGEMSARAQVKLLRILELGEVRRVGETRTRTVKVRVIAATNADLREEIRAGRFRTDLYYRLGGLEVTLPPLRERLGDVPLLAAHFARTFTNDGPLEPEIAPEALDLLLRHTWPGNVRELRFCVEKAAALTSALGRTRIEADCIDLDPIDPAPAAEREVAPEEDQVRTIGLDGYIENIERRLILKALEESGWNRTRAARALGGISRTTLIGKMKRLGLFPGPARKEEEQDADSELEEGATPE